MGDYEKKKGKEIGTQGRVETEERKKGGRSIASCWREKKRVTNRTGALALINLRRWEGKSREGLLIKEHWELIDKCFGFSEHLRRQEGPGP